MQTENPQSDVLNLDEFTDIEYRRASTGKRFGNYIIDLIIFYIFIYILWTVLFLLSPAMLEYFTSSSLEANLMDRFITLLSYALYMGAMETILKGRSIGKLITGTRAVNMDGSYISAKTAFLRGLSRAVPFCAFSALGNPSNPWQDRWTDTMVVTK